VWMIAELTGIEIRVEAIDHNPRTFRLEVIEVRPTHTSISKSYVA
jgi:hypothetical protein